MPSDSPVSRALAQVPLFQAMDPAALSQLEEQSWVQTYPAGQILASEGEPGESLLVVESGEVKISRFTRSGQEVVLAMVEAPDAIGELALLDGAPRSATITALTPVEIRVVPRQAFLTLLEAEPQTMLRILQVLAGMVRSTNERLFDILSLDVPGRVAKWLLLRAASKGTRQPDGIAIPFTLSQGELASELGTTRVSINKALRTFETIGAIRLEDDRIVLLNADLLMEYTY